MNDNDDYRTPGRRNDSATREVLQKLAKAQGGLKMSLRSETPELTQAEESELETILSRVRSIGYERMEALERNRMEFLLNKERIANARNSQDKP